MALLSCRDLALGYDGKEIINGLNFEVNAGDYLCIVGENGSGKTTLMRTILGLLPPMRGEVATGDGLLRTEIGYLPQQTVVQRDFPASVWEIVLSGCQNQLGKRSFYSRAQKQLARENLERMGLKDLQNRCYRELSGGQQQRVLLARALCATKKMLLLDEPVTGLDPRVTAELYEQIAVLNRRDHTTIVMISHDIQASVQYADHILHIGDTVFFGTTEEYLKEDIAGAFLRGGGAS